MAMTREQLLSEAMALDASQRELLAEELMRSLTDAELDQIDAAWLAEARRRDAELAAGRATLVPVDEVIERIRSRASR